MVQVVDEVFDPVAARRMGIDQKGQVVVMIHSGSRGLGHQVRGGQAGGSRLYASSSWGSGASSYVMLRMLPL